MSLTFIPGENILMEEDGVWYYGSFSGFNKLAVGHLVLTNKRLMFYEKKPRGGAGLMSTPSLETVGLAINITLERLIGAKIEERVRARWSRPNWKRSTIYEELVSGKRKFNVPPHALDSKDNYIVLIISLAGESGTENLTFEVVGALSWLNAVKKLGIQSETLSP